MITVWMAILAITFVLSVRNTALGCCMLIFTRILVPENVRLTPLVDISLNTGVIGVIGLFLLRDFLLHPQYIRVVIKDPYTKILVLFAALLLLSIVFGSCFNTQRQLSYWWQYCITDIFPAIAVIASTKNKKEIQWLLYSFLIAVLINTVYGVITVIIGANPYPIMMVLLYPLEGEGISITDDIDLVMRGGVITTSSTFVHANSWGIFLPLAFAFHFFLFNYTKKKMCLWAIFLLSICIFLSGKRTAIVSYFCFWLGYWWYSEKKTKKVIALYGIGFLILVLILVYTIPQLESARGLVESSVFFWDDSLREKNDIGGSSMALRIDQTLYPWVDISDNILFGHGFGYNKVYFSMRGLHPVLLGFETILSQAVCNGGVLGVFTWIYFFVYSYKYSALKSSNKVYPKMLTLCALAIAVANGLDLIMFYVLFIVLFNRVYKFNITLNDMVKNG